MIQTARTNASLTHDTLWGNRFSVLVALLSHFALYTNEPFTEFARWCGRMKVDQIDSSIDLTQLQAMLDIQWSGPVRQTTRISVAQATVHSVMHLLSRRNGLCPSMLQAVRWGGDVDSVMAITWGIQSTRIREPLPVWLEIGLEDGSFGRRFLIDLGTKLME